MGFQDLDHASAQWFVMTAPRTDGKLTAITGPDETALVTEEDVQSLLAQADRIAEFTDGIGHALGIAVDGNHHRIVLD